MCDIKGHQRQFFIQNLISPKIMTNIFKRITFKLPLHIILLVHKFVCMYDMIERSKNESVFECYTLKMF